ncbi:MAG: hypothetical protein R3A50_01930 [Saprospiraceae bacterium]
MKKMYLLSVFLLSVLWANAQVDVEISPLPLIFKVYTLSVEVPAAKKLGINGDVYFTPGFSIIIDKGYIANLSFKYYFNPKGKIDRFHVGSFMGTGSELNLALGALIGYKFVSRKNIIFEIGFGLGQDLIKKVEAVTVYGKFHIGYRF